MTPRFRAIARAIIPAMIPAAGLAASLLAGGCHRAPKAPVVIHPWVRLPAVAGQPAAAYFTLAGDGQDETLVKIESALAAKAELHGSMKSGSGMMTMKPLDRVALPAGGTVIFAPGGYHVMLIGLDQQVKAGTAVPLRFGFANGGTAEAEAKTVNAGDPAPY